MKVNPALKTETAQRICESALIVMVLIVLPALPLGKYGGGIVMLVASVVGLVVYFAWFARA